HVDEAMISGRHVLSAVVIDSELRMGLIDAVLVHMAFVAIEIAPAQPAKPRARLGIEDLFQLGAELAAADGAADVFVILTVIRSIVAAEQIVFFLLIEVAQLRDDAVVSAPAWVRRMIIAV